MKEVIAVKRIVIVGAGYAGLECALTLQRKLKGEKVHVTLVNRHDYHYPATLLHRVSLGTYSARKARVFIRTVLDTDRIEFAKDIVEHVDLSHKVVEGVMSCYPYDYLVLAAGFTGNTFGLPGVETYAYQMTSMNTAERLLADMEQRFKNYSFNADPARLKFAVVGNGFTGVEYAAELVDRTRELCRICGIDYRNVDITLVGRHESILPMLGDRGGALAKRKLLDMGVHYLVGSAVRVHPEGVEVECPDGTMRTVLARTVLWAAGVQGSPLVSDAGLPQRGNRVTVDDHLRVPGSTCTYVIGDCAAFTGAGESRPYPPTGQIAQQMGRYVGRELVAAVRGAEPTKPFAYRYRGTVCSLSHLDAVGLVGGKVISGEFAAFIKNFIENKWLFELGGGALVMKKGQFRMRTSD